MPEVMNLLSRDNAVFFSKIIKWSSFLSKSFNKVLVEVGKSGEASDFTKIGKSRLFLDCFNLNRVHDNLALAHN